MTTLELTAPTTHYDKIGNLFVSNFTDEEAAKVCDTHYFDNNFVKAIVRAYYSRFGASEAQLNYIHIYAVKATTKSKTAATNGAAPEVAPTVLSNLHSIFMTAKRAGRFLNFRIPTPLGTLTLRAMRDYIKVADNKFGTYYGRISYESGTFQPARAVKLGITQELVTIDSDPHGYMKASGLTSGICCYCARTLTDERSVKMGYGPVCAEYHGLPWGE